MCLICFILFLNFLSDKLFFKLHLIIEKLIIPGHFTEKPRTAPLGSTGEGRFIKKGILSTF
jgi:hypothetical protein